jgi:hypothetical protein
MNAASKPPKPADARPTDLKTEFVLGSIKRAIHRVEEIRQEQMNAGTALKAGYLTPQDALDWAEEVAPSCVGFVPALSGLSVKRGGGGQ